MPDTILILDFGSQSTQLIGRRLREMNVYCEVYPAHRIPEPWAQVKGVILSGSPFSVLDENAPAPDLSKFRGHLPVLGICFGAQYLAHTNGGTIQKSGSGEYGRASLQLKEPGSLLFKGIPAVTQVWMSHGENIEALPKNAHLLASTEDVQHAAFKLAGEETYGVQFHPEVSHSVDGSRLLENFAKKICHCQGDWTPSGFVASGITLPGRQSAGSKCTNIRNTISRQRISLRISKPNSTVFNILSSKIRQVVLWFGRF
jgi:GMP synthase (glutamine-hydrolysing)